jgi:inner membrane protein
MDNVTHTLVGAALAETGLKKWTPLASATLMIGANFPDLDIVTGLFGTLPYLEHHRGLTHALVALPPLAALLAGLMCLFARWRGGRYARARFGPLFALSLLAILTHPLLDYTNSYGWRPFQPWSDRWYYGDTAFVVDPWVWLLVGGTLCLATAKTRLRLILWAAFFAALAVPILLFEGAGGGLKLLWIFLAALAVGLRALRTLAEATTRAVAISALGVLLAYFGARAWLHQVAVRQLSGSAARVIQAERVEEVHALPLPLDPLRWQAAIVTDQAYHLAPHRLSEPFPAGHVTRHARTTGDAAAIAAARGTSEIQTFLRFARFPVFEARPAPNQTTEIAVSDARFINENGRARSTFRTTIRLDQNLQPVVEE